MRTRVESALSGAAASFFQDARKRLADEGAAVVAELLPSLPRRVGATPLGGGVHEVDVGESTRARVDLAAWRLCDAAGSALLDEAGTDADALVDLYLHGDLEERIIVLRALGLRPITDATIQLLGEAQRTNMESHFKAAVCDTNLPLRAAAHPDFGPDGFRKMVLKAAFVGLPIEQLLDVERGADEELSRMLQDLATEREAAGRGVWPGTSLLIAYAPTAGTVARVLGGLEHGDDKLRLAAARGLVRLNRKELAPFAKERLPREPRREIRDVLEQATR